MENNLSKYEEQLGQLEVKPREESWQKLADKLQAQPKQPLIIRLLAKKYIRVAASLVAVVIAVGLWWDYSPTESNLPTSYVSNQAKVQVVYPQADEKLIAKIHSLREAYARLGNYYQQ